MPDDKLNVILLEADATAAAPVLDAFAGEAGSRFRVEHLGQLGEALKRLGRDDVDIALVGFRPADGIGLGAIGKIVQAAPCVIVIVLGSGAEDAEDARLALAQGAHDYLARGAFDARGLPKFLGYVMRERAARNAQSIAENRFQALSAASTQGVCIVDGDGVCLFANAAFAALAGQSAEQAVGRPWSSLIHPKDRPRAQVQWLRGVATQAPFDLEYRFLLPDRRAVWVRAHAVPMQEGSQSFGYAQTLEDITEQKLRELVLKSSEGAGFEDMACAQAALEAIGDAVVAIDGGGRVSYLNPAAERLLGLARLDVLDQPVVEVMPLIDGNSRKSVDNPMLRAMQENCEARLAAGCLLVCRDGRELAIDDTVAPIRTADGQVSGAVIVFRDLGEVAAQPSRACRLAEHDFLTGLPNRLLLSDRLAQAIEQARRQRTKIALLVMDIDYFKHINVSLGHLIGDELLCSVARRLVTSVRGMDTVCRYGGDEFVVLMGEIDSADDAIHIAEKLLASVSLPHVVDAHVLHLTLSIGISIYPDDGEDAATIIQHADTAMHHAKGGGRNRFQFFRPEMNANAIRRLNIEKNLRRALKNNEFELHYQPKIRLATGAISGAEALLRWEDPDEGVIYPAQFIEIAEESGLIVPIGQWVLREACRQVQSWLDAGLDAVPVAVNISAAEFRNKSFLEDLVLILQDTGVAPHYLQLELTESVLMHNPEAAVATLKKLRAMGISLALDDFGTGYSSLNYLQRFPISTLKIDQSFVSDIATSRDDRAIVNAVISMGRNLNQRVVAEGVETDEQCALLQAQQCDEGQGFHFSPPLPAEDFTYFLAAA